MILTVRSLAQPIDTCTKQAGSTTHQLNSIVTVAVKRETKLVEHVSGTQLNTWHAANINPHELLLNITMISRTRTMNAWRSYACQTWARIMMQRIVQSIHNAFMRNSNQLTMSIRTVTKLNSTPSHIGHFTSKVPRLPYLILPQQLVHTNTLQSIKSIKFT